MLKIKAETGFGKAAVIILLPIKYDGFLMRDMIPVTVKLIHRSMGRIMKFHLVHNEHIWSYIIIITVKIIRKYRKKHRSAFAF